MNTHNLVYHVLIFLERLAQLEGGTTAAQALLPVLENNCEMAQVVAGQDIRLTTGTIEISSPNGPKKPTLQNHRTVAFWNHYFKS